MPTTTRPKRSSASLKRTKRKLQTDPDHVSELSEQDDASLDSDALDDTDDDASAKKKRASPNKKQSKSPRKKRKVVEQEYEPSDGEEIYGEVVKAHTTGLGMWQRYVIELSRRHANAYL